MAQKMIFLVSVLTSRLLDPAMDPLCTYVGALISVGMSYKFG